MTTEIVKPIATRAAFGKSIVALGEKYPEIVVLDADLSCSTKSEGFGKKFPERFFQMGIAEANMIGTAAGLAASGYIPFACSFAAFLTGRFDQIRMSVSYTDVPVRLIGTHAGVGIGEDGHSQMGLEDLACMRSMPNMTVLQPADDIETAAMLEELIKHPNPAYIRLTRQNVSRVHADNTEFKIGKIHELQKGDGILVLASGGVVQHSLQAAQALQSEGLSIQLANVSSLRPLDASYLDSVSEKFSKIITVEDHYTAGGLGGVIAEYLACSGSSAKLSRIGVEKFGQSGTPDGLYEHYGLDTQSLIKKFKEIAG